MTTILFVLATFLLMAMIAAPIVFVQTRKIFREQKNYERGLKIVPLMIHLPPPSDDLDVGGRDARDVDEEVISRAQTIYSIIASTLQKGFRSNFYGQRHFAFEIIGSQGFVYFYAAVPIALLETVKQAITTAYPTARLEEVAEHNIFSKIGKASATLGGELSLRENYAYPIATFTDIKRDAMVALLNSLASLDKEDGAAIQFLLRPADPNWTKQATKLAGNKRKGSSGGLGPMDMLKALPSAFVKPPDGGKDDSKPKELSSLEQATYDAIDEKTRHPGFEVAIRVVTSSNIAQRSEAILAKIIASFQLYDAPGKNGFKYTPAKDVDSLVTSYLMRFFPQTHNKNVLNSVELATLFHFPDQRNIPTSQLTRQDSKQVDGPRNIPEDGLLLGYNVFRGAKKPIRLSLGDRQRHMYVVGQTGTGKSTFLENIALQDMLSGNGFAFVDPHGDVVEKLMAMVPKERTEDVIYFNPADMEYPMGLNLFEFDRPDQKDFLVQETLNMLQKLYDPQHQGIMGPRYEHIFRNAALAIMADPRGGTFVDIPKLFRDPQFLKEKLSHVTDNTVLEYWQKEYPASQRSNDAGEITSWFVSKFGAFLSNEMMRNIIGQTKSAFDLRDIMDNKKILLVNLSKGRTGDLNSKLLGMIFVMKFQAAAMSRSDIPEDDRVDFSLYVDEFQNFSTDSFATIMSEARKYHLNLIVANQFTTQLTDEIRDAVFGNMGTIVSFRIGQNDVEGLGRYFQPTFDGDDLLRIPNHNTIVRTLIGGVPTNPFSMATLPPLGTPNDKLGAALKQLAAAKYGKPRAIVEKDIFDRLATRQAPKPAAGTGFGTAAPAANNFGARPTTSAAPAQAAAPAAPKPGSSFLDDWLDKRRTGVTAPAVPAYNSATPAPSAPASVAPVAPTPAALPTSSSAPAPSFAAPAPVPATGANFVSAAPQPINSFAPAPQPQPLSPVAPVQQAPIVDTPQITHMSQKPLMQEPGASDAQTIFTPTPQPVALQPESNNNISSNELEQGEVNKIAAELKQQMTNAAVPVKPVSRTNGTSDLKPGDDDTIFIDRDGSFHINEVDEVSK